MISDWNQLKIYSTINRHGNHDGSRVLSTLIPWNTRLIKRSIETIRIWNQIGHYNLLLIPGMINVHMLFLNFLITLVWLSRFHITISNHLQSSAIVFVETKRKVFQDLYFGLTCVMNHVATWIHINDSVQRVLGGSRHLKGTSVTQGSSSSEGDASEKRTFLPFSITRFSFTWE